MNNQTQTKNQPKNPTDTTTSPSKDPYGHLTIGEAFEKHYRENPDYFRPETFDEYYCRILTGHDIIHFLYGCDTSYRGEALVSIVEFTKTNFKYLEYLRYVTSKQGWATTRKVYADIGGFWIIRKFLPHLVRNWNYVRQMEKHQTQKIGYTQFNAQRDRLVSDIRAEYNIVPLM